MLAPGNQVRAARIDVKSGWLAITAIAYNMGEIVWHILKNPLCWFAAALSFLYGNLKKTNCTNNSFINLIKQKQWVLPLFSICFLIAAIAPGVIALKGGLLPDRYLNAATWFVVMLLLLYSFIIGAQSSFDIQGLPFSKLKMYNASCIILAVGILCNTTIANAYKSLIAAPLYSRIIAERENILSAAADKTALIPDYQSALQAHLQKDYAQSSKTLYNMVQQKPFMLFFEDDLSTVYTIDILKRYYQLDSLIIKPE